jgi:DNA-binding NarL/FixJ family response regulator
MTVKALIIEPDHSARLRFRKFTEAHPGYARCTASSTLSEGTERLRIGSAFDAIYISTRFDPFVVSHFMETTRTVYKGNSSAQIIVVDPNCTGKVIQKFSAAKPDGYLLEPTSGSDLDGSVEFITQRKHNRAESSLKASVQMNQDSLVNQKQAVEEPRVAVNIKALCARMAVAIDQGKAGLTELKKLSKRVEMLDEEELMQYYDELSRYMSELRQANKNNP